MTQSLLNITNERDVVITRSLSDFYLPIEIENTREGEDKDIDLY